MKDLKHLYTFEKLLLESNNDLVRQAADRGDKIIGINCFQLPEAFYNLPGITAIHVRAPRTGTMEMGTYYMTSMTCEYCRAVVERALEGGYQFLDAILETAACSQVADCFENLERLQLCNKEGFFIAHIDAPMKSDDNAVQHMIRMTRKRILDRLTEEFGTDTSEDALRKSVEIHNEVCRLVSEIGAYRAEENPRITGYEFAVICLVTYACPKDLLLPMLRETAEELKKRKPDSDKKKKYRARVLLVGSEIDDADYVKEIEEAGALVVADRYCYGSYPDRIPIELNDKEDVLTQICRHVVKNNQCPRYMDMEAVQYRKDVLDQLMKQYHADGIIVQQMKFCNFWGYERAGMQYIMREEYGYPVLSMDRPYVVASSGQLRTRVQAFVESIEIKQIQKTGKGGDD